MESTKEIIENAHFTIKKNIDYEGFVCIGKKYKKIHHRTNRNLFFTSKDILVDIVIQRFRPTPKVSNWRNRLPLMVIESCYTVSKQKKMSFVLDFTQNDPEDRTMDYLICIFDEKLVHKTPQYTEIYDTIAGKRRVGV